jgi:hypothetical protein
MRHIENHGAKISLQMLVVLNFDGGIEMTLSMSLRSLWKLSNIVLRHRMATMDLGATYQIQHTRRVDF